MNEPQHPPAPTLRHAAPTHGSHGLDEHKHGDPQPTQVAKPGHLHTGHTPIHHVHPTHAVAGLALPSASPFNSVLAWPAWLRVLAVLPVLVMLWLAVAWASAEVAPW